MEGCHPVLTPSSYDLNGTRNGEHRTVAGIVRAQHAATAFGVFDLPIVQHALPHLGPSGDRGKHDRTVSNEGDGRTGGRSRSQGRAGHLIS